MVCLETCFLVDLFRNRSNAVQAKERLDSHEEEVCVAAPSIVELMRNAARNKNKKEERMIEELVKEVRILPLDAKSAEMAGRIEAKLMEQGNSIDFEDLLIGTIALMNDEAILTANRRHFERIPGLKVLTY